MMRFFGGGASGRQTLACLDGGGGRKRTGLIWISWSLMPLCLDVLMILFFTKASKSKEEQLEVVSFWVQRFQNYKL